MSQYNNTSESRKFKNLKEKVCRQLKEKYFLNTVIGEIEVKGLRLETSDSFQS